MLPAQLLLGVVAAYLAVGALIGLAFVVRGVQRVDRAAENAPWAFRLLILPGSIALWPVVALRWLNAMHEAGRP